MSKQAKTFEMKVLDRTKEGGRIIINTGGLDRDRDRVLPMGALTENYLKNPVVQWGHDYRSPSSTIGKTNAIEIREDSIVADFTLRPAANDQDPQNIVRLLWEGEWVRTASIGFIPKQSKPNAEGGTDFTSWELLEFSLVPIPANAEALRLAVKGLNSDAIGFYETKELSLEDTAPIEKRGRVLSAKNEASLRQASELMNGVLAQLDETTPDEKNLNIGSQESLAKTATDAAADSPALLDESELAQVLQEYVKNLKEGLL